MTKETLDMKRFQKDCIGDIVSIADLTLSPAGGLAAFQSSIHAL